MDEGMGIHNYLSRGGPVIYKENDGCRFCMLLS
jgi:hypothetical protein